MKELVDRLREIGILKTPSIIEAFLAIDRKDFIPNEMKDAAYIDEALPIGWGQTVSQPYTVAFMLGLLSPQPGETILDIGAGSGWQTAMLANIVGDAGKVHAIEIIPELCEFGVSNVSKYNFIKSGHVLWHCGDGDKAVVDDGEADRIIAAASIYRGEKNAASCIPENWKKQLKICGIIVTPVGQSLWKFTKKPDRSFDVEEHPGFVFVPYV